MELWLRRFGRADLAHYLRFADNTRRHYLEPALF